MSLTTRQTCFSPPTNYFIAPICEKVESTSSETDLIQQKISLIQHEMQSRAENPLYGLIVFINRLCAKLFSTSNLEIQQEKLESVQLNQFINTYNMQHNTSEEVLDVSKLSKQSCFGLYGLNTVGLYRDLQHREWFLKKIHNVNEFIAISLYSLLMNGNVPRVQFAVDFTQKKLFLASRKISGFTSMYYMLQTTVASSSRQFTEYKGKPITGLLQAICAMALLKEKDAHSGNVGVVDAGKTFTFVKIDCDESLNINPENNSQAELTLDDLRYSLRMMRRIHPQTFIDLNPTFPDLETFGFDAVYGQIVEVANFDFSKLVEVIEEKIAFLKEFIPYIEEPAYGIFIKESRTYDVTKATEKIVPFLKKRHKDFSTIAKYMLLEKSIIDHDKKTFNSLLKQNVSLTKPFKSFFNVQYKGDFFYSPSLSVTGKALLKKHWPEFH